MKIPQETEVRASQLYDLMYDEARVFNPSVEEFKLALSMLAGSLIQTMTDSDDVAYDHMKQMLEQMGESYLKAKQIQKDKARNVERETIKLADS